MTENTKKQTATNNLAMKLEVVDNLAGKPMYEGVADLLELLDMKIIVLSGEGWRFFNRDFDNRACTFGEIFEQLSFIYLNAPPPVYHRMIKCPGSTRHARHKSTIEATPWKRTESNSQAR